MTIDTETRMRLYGPQLDFNLAMLARAKHGRQSRVAVEAMEIFQRQVAKLSPEDQQALMEAIRDSRLVNDTIFLARRTAPDGTIFDLTRDPDW